MNTTDSQNTQKQNSWNKKLLLVTSLLAIVTPTYSALSINGSYDNDNFTNVAVDESLNSDSDQDVSNREMNETVHDEIANDEAVNNDTLNNNETLNNEVTNNNSVDNTIHQDINEATEFEAIDDKQATPYQPYPSPQHSQSSQAIPVMPVTDTNHSEDNLNVTDNTNNQQYQQQGQQQLNPQLNQQLDQQLAVFLVRMVEGQEQLMALNGSNGASELQAGDILEYRSYITNNMPNRVRSMQVTMSIPPEVELIGHTVPEFVMGSLDQSQFYPAPLQTQRDGMIQNIALSKYQALRWQVEDLDLGETTTLSYRARVK